MTPDFLQLSQKSTSTLNLTTKWKNIPDLGTKIRWTLQFEREIYFNTDSHVSKWQMCISSLALPNRKAWVPDESTPNNIGKNLG